MSRYLSIGWFADLPGVENRPETPLMPFRRPHR